MRNALTIDVEDYYQVSAFESLVPFNNWEQYESRVERNTSRLLDLFDAQAIHATFFVLGWVAERHPDLVLAIHERGHEVASHGYAHQRVYTQAPEQFRIETQRSKRILEDIVGQPVLGYRAASYSITAKSLWALDILQELGFVYDSSIFPVHHDKYGIPQAQRFCHVLTENKENSLVEFPLSTVQCMGTNIPIAGGGYFRLFPYSFTRWGLRRVNQKERHPVVVYLHPWEIDPDQPRLPARGLSRWRHYINLARTEKRLAHLLRDFQWGTMAEVLQQLGLLATRDTQAP
jgi:polysaccharide deacetylase family protein (PEP-CTERM system associated)